MDANSSKLVLAIAGAAILVGGVVAVRSLTGPNANDKIEISESAGTDGAKSGTTIETTNDNGDGNSRSKSRSDRSISRGQSAASLAVTPATTVTASAKAPFGLAGAADDAATTSTAEEEAKEIADLVAKFSSSTDVDDRIDAADELGLIDSPESIKAILELLKTETDPSVQAALLEAMQGLEALELSASDVLQAARDLYARTDNPEVRIAAQDLLGDLGTPEAVQALREMRNNPNIDPAEKLNAAENLMRIHAFEPELISESELQELNSQLRLDYQAGQDVAFRSQAIMALAVNGRSNVDFFQQAYQTEQDPGLKGLLERLIRMFTAPPAATPPPGTVVTPAPTP